MCSGCGHEARSARGHARATHVLRDGDEADAADRETTAAVPAGSGLRQRRERQRESAWRILRQLSLREKTRKSSKGARSGRSCEGMAAPRDVHRVRTPGALGPRARPGVGGATYVLRDGDEADAADRETTAAVPARSDASQRRERQRERARRILRRLGISEETRRSSKGARSGRSCEGVAAPRSLTCCGMRRGGSSHRECRRDRAYVRG